MATETLAKEYLINGLKREVELYEGTWTGTDVTTNLGDILNTATAPVGVLSLLLHKGEMVKAYTRDDCFYQLEAADDGNLIRGFLVDAPHGNVGTGLYRRGVVYFFGVGDIVLLDCDITHDAIAIEEAVDVDAIGLSGTNKHGITLNDTGGTGFGKSINALAINTVGTVAIRVTGVN